MRDARHTRRDDLAQFHWGRTPSRRPPTHLPRLAALLAVVVTLAAGLVVAASAATSSAAAPGGAPAVAALALPPAVAPITTTIVAARATRLRIPALGVDTALVPIDVDGAGVLQPPATTDVAGWFVRGAAPAQPGPAVVAGHIDSYRGPAVFFRLHEMSVGDDVQVDTSGGPPVHYRVVGIETVPKTSFPTERVYGPTPGPELRLITCGGEFDRTDRRYLRNVIVSALLVP